MTSIATGTSQRLTPLQWLICAIAALGFAFDTYELLMLPLIVRPALSELLGVPPNSLMVNDWVGYMQYVPAVAGGIFGLIGGYLTDLFGRRRVLVWSILLYGFSALAAGFSTSVYWLLFWRCCTFVGVCVEFVAAVAWLAELFSDPAQRERVIGYTQAFASFGGVMATGAYYWIVSNAESLPAIMGGHEAWRYTLMSGLAPAIPLMIIRPFLPESPKWEQRKREGTLKRPSFGELFAPRFRRTTIVTTVMMAAVYGAAFGAIQQMPRIVPGLEEVRASGADRAGTDHQRRPDVSGSRRHGGTRRAGVPRRDHHRAPPADLALSDPRVLPAARGVLPHAGRGPGVGAMGDLPRRLLHRRANEFLGQLSAARLPRAPARHGREFRSQRRRPHDRHVRRTSDDVARQRDAGSVGPDQARLCGRASSEPSRI